ncbi:unnamed protein product, partial [Ectocarpus sp. 8 AP-2014]
TAALVFRETEIGWWRLTVHHAGHVVHHKPYHFRPTNTPTTLASSGKRAIPRPQNYDRARRSVSFQRVPSSAVAVRQCPSSVCFPPFGSARSLYQGALVPAASVGMMKGACLPKALSVSPARPGST